MKILHVINGLGSGGAEKLVVEICNGLATDYPTGLFLLENKNSFFLQDVDSKVKVFAKSSNRFNPLILLYLWKEIKNYDVIHAHLFPTLYYVAIMTLFYPKKKFVFTEHNTTNSRRNISFLNVVERVVYNRYDTITCISAAVMRNISQWIGPAQNILLLYNFINEEKIRNFSRADMEELGFGNEDKIVVMVGSFNNLQKRQQDLINALDYLPLQYKALFIGGGDRLKEYELLVKEKNLTNRVMFLGTRKDVYSILKASHFGVLASEWEGFGLVALEYMACGIPALGSDVDGLNEVITDERCLFMKGNAAELAQKMKYINEHVEVKKNILSAQSELAEKFNRSTYLSKLLNIYNSR